MAKCLWCGRECGESKRRKKKYCSVECREKYSSRVLRGEKPRDEHLKQLRANAKNKKVCEHCGEEFVYRPGGHNLKTGKGGRFCSQECRMAYAANTRKGRACKVYFINCSVCGKLFTAKNKASKICSEKCIKKYKRTYNKKRYRDKVNKLKEEPPRFKCIITCAECGVEFTASYGDKRKKFCSDGCCTKHYKRKARSARRARKRALPYELIDPIKVFERDNFTCQICGTKTPRELRGTWNDDAPELDHIIPLSKGGPHILANVQCTCRICNIVKGDEILAA